MGTAVEDLWMKQQRMGGVYGYGQRVFCIGGGGGSRGPANCKKG